MKKKSIIMILVVIISMTLTLFTLTACNTGDGTSNNDEPKIVKQYGKNSFISDPQLSLYDDGTFTVKFHHNLEYIKREYVSIGTYEYGIDNGLELYFSNRTTNWYAGTKLLESVTNTYHWTKHCFQTEDSVYGIYDGSYALREFSNKDEFEHNIVTELLERNVFTQNEIVEDTFYCISYEDQTFETVPIDNIDTSELGIFYVNENKNLKYYVVPENCIKEELVEVYKKEEIETIPYEYDVGNIYYFKGEKDPNIFLNYQTTINIKPTEILNFSTDKVGKFEMIIKYKNVTKIIPYEVIEKGIPLRFDDFYYLNTFLEIPAMFHKKETNIDCNGYNFRVLISGDNIFTKIENVNDYIQFDKDYDESFGISSFDVVYENQKGKVRYPVLLFTYDDNHTFLNQPLVEVKKEDYNFSIDVKNKTFKINGEINLIMEDNLSNDRIVTISQDNILDYSVTEESTSLWVKYYDKELGVDYYFTLLIME